MTEPRPVILDCDPGHDDALAIVLALARPIETESELMHGRTVVDLPGLRRLPACARVGASRSTTDASSPARRGDGPLP